jgi:DNA-directed RNA polymerase specialized sigma24 family protein
MVGGQAASAAEISALREQLCAAQRGAEAAYRSALTWVARRAEAHAAAIGAPAESVVQAALLLVHAQRHTYDPARDPVAWVDAIIVLSAPRRAAYRAAVTVPTAAANSPR